MKHTPGMARTYKELQAKMVPEILLQIIRRVDEELQRMAFEEICGAKPLTEADIAEISTRAERNYPVRRKSVQ